MPSSSLKEIPFSVSSTQHYRHRRHESWTRCQWAPDSSRFNEGNDKTESDEQRRMNWIERRQLKNEKRQTTNREKKKKKTLFLHDHLAHKFIIIGMCNLFEQTLPTATHICTLHLYHFLVCIKQCHEHEENMRAKIDRKKKHNERTKQRMKRRRKRESEMKWGKTRTEQTKWNWRQFLNVRFVWVAFFLV